MDGFGLLMIVFWVLVLAGGVWLVATVVRGSTIASSTSAAVQTPLAILQPRYARGEITKEQFDAIKRDLGV